MGIDCEHDCEKGDRHSKINQIVVVKYHRHDIAAANDKNQNDKYQEQGGKLCAKDRYQCRITDEKQRGKNQSRTSAYEQMR